MDSFGFIIHPIDSKKDISRKYPLLGQIANDWMIKYLSPFFPPIILSEIKGIQSNYNHRTIKGWLLACPLSPRHFVEMPVKKVYRKIIQTGRLAEELGAKILGLGAFTSVVGDAGISVAKELEIPVTTGDAYTIAVTIQAMHLAVMKMNIFLKESAAAVVGATGTIGRTCSHLLSQEVSELYLIGRDYGRLNTLRDELSDASHARLIVSTNMSALRGVQLIVSATSASTPIIFSEHLSPGSVVCDVARPRDVSPSVLATRHDVLIIDGGIVEVPGAVDFHFDFGLPPGKAYACMAETIALTLEGRFDDYTLGKIVSSDQVKEISSIAKKHGFQLSKIRSFESIVTEEHIESIQLNAKNCRRHLFYMGG